jgi:UDP-N-acetyl-D-mannosaminuronic acid dehydrogenase
VFPDLTKIYGLPSEEVTALLRAGKITIDVVGIGKMGLPLAALLAREGARVIGVRRNEELVEQVNRGICPITEEPDLAEIIEETVGKGLLKATTDAAEAARQSDVILILVPLLVDSRGNPDFTQMRDACSSAARGLEKGDLVIIETTMPPGAIQDVVIPLLEESGLGAGKDFGIAHAPERLMTGRVIRNMYRYPKIVGGLDGRSTEAAAGLYTPFGEVVKVANLATAELVKVAEGIYRDVNIAYANTLALFCEKHGVDAWEVIAAANHQTSDYCHIHLPGSGVGGHCIPVYPLFLINRGSEYGSDVSLIREGRRINDSMPAHMKELVDLCLADQGKDPASSSVGVLGIAFRGGVKENRLSPGIALLRMLTGYGRVLAHDPMYSQEEIRGMGFEPATFEEVLSCDCVALVTAHGEYSERARELTAVSPRLVDGRNLVPGARYRIGSLVNRPTA